jgi:hypothetical protein
VHSNFDNPLELSSDRRKIVATGPLGWDPGDAEHCRIKVKITQGNRVGHGDTGNYNQGETWWECDVKVDGGGQWQVADVTAHGTIEMSGPPPPSSWPDQTVSLQLQTAAAPQA